MSIYFFMKLDNFYHLQNWDYYLHLYCYIHNLSADAFQVRLETPKKERNNRNFLHMTRKIKTIVQIL